MNIRKTTLPWGTKIPSRTETKKFGCPIPESHQSVWARDPRLIPPDDINIPVTHSAGQAWAMMIGIVLLLVVSNLYFWFH